MASGDATTALKVRTEQVRTLYRQTGTLLTGNGVNASIVGVLLWGSAPRHILLGWMGLILVNIGARIALTRWYWASRSQADAQLWGCRFAFGSATAGILWGSAGYLVLDEAGPHALLLVALFVGGMCAAAAGTLACYFPAFLAFTIPALGAIGVRASFAGSGSLPVAMVITTALYAVGLGVAAWGNHKALTAAFRLRFENADLLTALTAARSRLEEANQTLEQRVAERTQALEQQALALRDAQRLEALGRLAGGVAHDFNNLLTVVLANVGELLEEADLGRAARSALSDVQEAASRGAALVRQLLLFARRQSATPQELDLNQVVTAMDRLLQRLLGDALRLHIVLHPGPLKLNIDRTQLEQVIINFVVNARDAMAASGVATLETQTFELLEQDDGLQPGRYCVVAVTDTGIGMDAATLHRVFEPFFTTKAAGKGTGLGLSTAYGIVTQNGGQIRVASELGRGSRFSAYFPLV
jgi:signal transduction histidine kinase